MAGDLGQEAPMNTVIEGGTLTLPRSANGTQLVGQADFRAYSPSPLLLLAERTQTLPEVMLGNLRNWDRPSLIRALAAKMHADPSWALSLEEAEALVCIYACDFYQTRSHENPQSSFWRGESLPWPTGAVESRKKISDGLGYSETQNGRVIRCAAGNFLDAMDGRLEANALHTVLMGACERMSQSNVALLGKYILDNLDTFYEHAVGNERNLHELFDLIFNRLDVYSEASLTQGREMIAFLQTRIGEKAVAISIPAVLAHPDYDYLQQFSAGDRPKVIFRALANGGYEAETRNKIVGMLTRAGGLPRQLNLLRSMVGDQHLSATEKEGLSRMLRDLLTLTAGLPVHTKLDDVYKAIQFESYPVNERTKAPRLASLRDLFERYGINAEAHILDLGSGTGWLTGSLRNAGYEHTVGIDASERNIEVAQKTYGPHFVRRDWQNTRLAEGSQEVVLCLGRSLPHTEERLNFEKTLAEIKRVVKDNGLVIFDMPDPTKGDYWVHVKSYREAMRHFGYSEYELKDFWHIVDSPDGINFYNRFVPPQKWIENELWVQNFELLEVQKEQIPNDRGDVNLVFVCRKLSKANRGKLVRHTVIPEETYS